MTRSRRRPSGNAGHAKKSVRGKPFARGADGRRNTKGRGRAKPHPSVTDEIIGALMEKVTIIKNGNRKRVPKVRAVLEQLLNQSVQGDSGALRNAATLVRAASGLKPSPPTSEASEPQPPHDDAALRRVLARYDKQIREADRSTRRMRGDNVPTD